MLDAVTTLYAPSQKNIYIDLITGTLPLYLENTVLDYREKIAKENPVYHQNEHAEMKFYNKQMEEYASSTPIYLITLNDFYLQYIHIYIKIN